jgi:hypothetical protein
MRTLGAIFSVIIRALSSQGAVAASAQAKQRSHFILWRKSMLKHLVPVAAAALIAGPAFAQSTAAPAASTPAASAPAASGAGKSTSSTANHKHHHHKKSGGSSTTGSTPSSADSAPAK